MEEKINFKVIHNRIGVYHGDNIITEMNIQEFNQMCADISLLKSNNPVLFEDKIEFLTIDKINKHKYGSSMKIGDDFIKGLQAINIRPVYFYKSDFSYLFFDFINEADGVTKDLKYGIEGYSINDKGVISICIENHDESVIKSGYVPNSYLRGILDKELSDSLKKIKNMKIMINSEEIDSNVFWSEENIVEYDTLFTQL